MLGLIASWVSALGRKHVGIYSTGKVKRPTPRENTHSTILQPFLLSKALQGLMLVWFVGPFSSLLASAADHSMFEMTCSHRATFTLSSMFGMAFFINFSHLCIEHRECALWLPLVLAQLCPCPPLGFPFVHSKLVQYNLPHPLESKVFLPYCSQEVYYLLSYERK